MQLSRDQQQEIHSMIVRQARNVAHRWKVPMSDVIQEGWVTAMVCLKKYQPEKGPFKNYFARSLHNKLNDYAAISRTTVDIPKNRPVQICSKEYGLNISSNNRIPDQPDICPVESWLRIEQALAVCEDLFGEGVSDALRDCILYDTKLPPDLAKKFRQFRSGRLPKALSRILKDL